MLRAKLRCSGFSMIEVLIALGIIGLLAAIAIPSYQEYVYKTEINHAAQDLASFALAIESYKFMGGSYPDTASEAGISINDPWGNAYRFKRIEGVKGLGGLRKDKNLVPINSDFDLYSVGRDGLTVGPLTAPKSHDDVIRANNGGYYGLGKNY